MLMAVKKSVTPKPASRSARRSRAAEAGVSTRDVLIREAMKLFAERAIDAVSLREIVQKAGQGNQSAIHYHFKDKQGLVIAVAEFVRARFERSARSSGWSTTARCATRTWWPGW